MASDKARAKAADPVEPEAKTVKRRTADGLVMLSMALVTLAMCLGLVLQAGFSFWLAVSVSAAFYLGLLSLHTLARRHDQLDELRKEVAALKGEVQTLRAGNSGLVPPRPASVSAQCGPAPSLPQPALDSMRAPPPRTGLSPAPSESTASPVEPAPHGRGPSTQAPAAPQPPIPTVVRAPDRPAQGPVAQSAFGAAEDARGTTPALGGINRVPRRVAPDPQFGAPDGAQRTPAMPAAVAAAAGPQAPVDPASTGPADAAYSPRESDVEMIHGLIKKLADEVNAAEPARQPAPRREAFDADALDESVEALRRTASSMRAPQAPSLPDIEDRSPVSEPRAMEAPSQDADLDVEALMRRAQPIATMSSMPPPLPFAPVGPNQGASVEAAARNGSRDRAAFDVDTAEEVSRVQQDRAAEASRERGGGAEREPAQDEPAAEWDASGLSAGDDLDAAPAREPDARVLAVADALEAGRVDVFLEPILDLEKQQPRHYEVSLRLRDAGDRSIDTFAAFADDDDDTVAVIAMLDSLSLMRTAQVAKRLGERGKQGAVFSTFNGSSLTADGFLTAFADTYDAQEELSRQLVLTFAQDDVRRFRAPHWTMLGEMRDLGFVFAVRAVTELDMDFGQLSAAGFKFVKLDSEVFLRGLPAPGAMVPAVDIARHLDDEGLAVVVEAIDDDAKRSRVASYGVELGQGALFGGPRLMKAAAISGERSAA